MTVAVTRLELSAGELRREAVRCREAAPRGGCWPWRWCWRGIRARRRRGRPGWTGRRLRDWVHRYNAEGSPACTTGPIRGRSRGSRPSRWRSWRRSSRQGPDPETGRRGALAAGRPAGADQGAASTSSCTSARSARCCAGSASPACRCGPSTRRAIPRRRQRSKRLRPSWCRRRCPSTRPASRSRSGSGRGPGRPAGHLDPDLGAPRHPPASAARPPLRLGLPVRRGLPRAGGRRRAGAAVRQRRGHEPASAGDQPACRPRRPRRPGAGWRRLAWPRGAGRVPRNLTLLPLPPYSPELNPVENVWEYLRQNQLSLRVWPDYAAIVETCCQAWNALMAMPERKG